jgi:hydrogenase nickel incorporation protein HypA/HybF
MHELSICQQLLSQVERIALEHGATAVDRVVVSVGPLSGVEPQLLERAFGVARAGTLAQQAVLEVSSGAVRIRCRSCGVEQTARPNRLLCDACGGWRIEVLEGTQLVLMTVELSGLPAKPQSGEVAGRGPVDEPRHQGAMQNV